jgi:O-antigen ligase
MNIPFYIICILIIFTPLARGSVHPWATTIIQIGILLAAIFTVMENFSLKKISLPKAPMNKPIVAIIILCILPFAFSNHKPFAVEGFFMLLIYITAYYIALSCVRTRKQQRTLVYVIISTALLLSVIGILKRFGLNPFTWWIYPEIGIDHNFTSVSGVYVNRNHLAGFLEMAIPMLLVLFLTRQRTTEARLGMVFLALFLLTTQAFTLSRGGWISTISAVLFIPAVRLTQKNSVQKKIIVAIGISALVISLFILSSLPVVERITTLTQQDQASNISSRMRGWKGVVNEIKDNLFFGTGPNTFTEAYPAYQIPGSGYLIRYAHNDYLHFISETGILFIPVLLFTLIWFFRSGFQKLKSRSRQNKGFALGAMAGIFAILIHSFSDFNLNIPANAFVFTIIAAIATQNHQRKSESICLQKSRRSKKVLAG